MQNKLKAFERLLIIMDELRTQCPWDKKQTMHTLRNLSIEETYELSEAIMNNDLDNVKILEGTGSPESVVVAGVGSTYHRNDGGAGTTYYVKESGSGNTEVITPISVLNAAATWCLILVVAAFQPNRPKRVLPVTGSVLRCALPDIPKGATSSLISSSAKIVSSGIASNKPKPTSCGAIRAENFSGVPNENW